MPEPQPSQPTALRFGRCELRLDTREVRLDGERQPVRRRVFDLIVYLIRQRPRAVPHAELLRALWQREQSSPSLLGRTVMEARRAVGDSGDEHRYIVSVHGVGYRFAAAVADLPVADAQLPAPDPDDDVLGDEAAELATRVAEARTAVFERRYGDAERLAADLMARAQALGSHAAMVRALMIRGSVAMHIGQLAQAARDISHALRLARAEGTAQLVAEAQLATGGLHVAAGDLDTGIRHLRSAMEALDRPGSEPDLIRCLSWLSLGLKRQGDLEAGLQVCRRSIRLGAQYNGPTFALGDRQNEVLFISALGDRDAQLGQRASAMKRYEEALGLNAALLADSGVAEATGLWLALLHNRTMLLERLDRLDEAWEEAQRHRAAIEAQGQAGAPVGRGSRATIDLQHARLLARRGHHQEALALVRSVVDFAVREDLRIEFEDIYSEASLIAEMAGDMAAALRWQGARCDALLQGQRTQSASLAAILAAEMNSEDLQAELAQALASADELKRSNAELQVRVARLEAAVPVDPQTGLADAALLPILFAAAFERARSRGLPMCIGLLAPAGAQLPAALRAPDTQNKLLRQVAAELAGLGDVAQPAARVGPYAVAFHVVDGGLRHAQAVCGRLLERLSAGAAGALTVAWRCTAVDAVEAGSIEAGVRTLMQR